MLSSREALVRIATRTGYPVRLAWSSHDKGAMGTVVGVMKHHTGTPLTSNMDDYPTLRVVRDGRPGLLNSLCAWGLGRSGTIYCVSDRISWHAGEGQWQGIADGNGHYWGIEAESDGVHWTAEQLDCYPRLVASALYELRRSGVWAPRHAEFALPPGRKWDTGGLDEPAQDRAVNLYLASPTRINRHVTQEGELSATEAQAINARIDGLQRKIEATFNAASRAEAAVRALTGRPEYDVIQAPGDTRVFAVVGGGLVHLSQSVLGLPAFGGWPNVEHVAADDPRLSLPVIDDVNV